MPEKVPTPPTPAPQLVGPYWNKKKRHWVAHRPPEDELGDPSEGRKIPREIWYPPAPGTAAPLYTV